MIHDVPNSADFFDSGKELLDLAWDMTIGLLNELGRAEDVGIDQKVKEAYWKASKRRLTTSLSLIQQGAEFILKGKIAHFSPFLLLADGPSKWPSPYKGEASIRFANFRTLESQDLSKAHDVLADTALTDTFKNTFNELRTQRNSIMHSVDRSLTVHAKQILESLLFIHSTLLPDENWCETRISFIQNLPTSILYGEDYYTNTICHEIETAIHHLEKTKAGKYFNINKRQHSFYCPQCYSNRDPNNIFSYRLARLSPNSRARKLYCPVCNEYFPVARKKCVDVHSSPDNDCPSTVISEEFGNLCLLCGRI